ncbi:SLC39A1_2_3 [Lepeophtheirus salmonis]|uniref:SLC39A1_2_3 n=1 Tax=Lepeophtheirus salmonis TaxID=72036 RepID=A0A7R8H8J0_LEPSM|nr:SLC39A1_2_3 [Lepeophtheirus salmonis]CAF2940770.1 SLC39A1_2_3 [Lepeophtheirus salmonis]
MKPKKLYSDVPKSRIEGKVEKMIEEDIISPPGIIIGIFVTNANDQESTEQTVVITVLNGLTAGTLLYVVFFEVLEKRTSKTEETWIDTGGKYSGGILIHDPPFFHCNVHERK